TVLIIDDQQFYRAGIRQALSEQPGMNILDSDLGRDPLDIVDEMMPDVVLLGSELGPHYNAIALSKRIVRYYRNTKVIILTPNPNEEVLFEVIKTSAVACLPRNIDSAELTHTIRRASQGEYPINDSVVSEPGVARRLLKQFNDISASRNGLKDVFAPLTSREKQILSYIAKGNKNKRIADVLGLAEQTIKCHVSAILRKLHANHRAHAVALAMCGGFVAVEDVELTINRHDKSPA
ncbi:LuxR C-terminal-related transcriptional regulator, partial [Chloroflexota bacterium]